MLKAVVEMLDTIPVVGTPVVVKSKPGALAAGLDVVGCTHCWFSRRGIEYRGCACRGIELRGFAVDL